MISVLGREVSILRWCALQWCSVGYLKFLHILYLKQKGAKGTVRRRHICRIHSITTTPVFGVKLISVTFSVSWIWCYLIKEFCLKDGTISFGNWLLIPESILNSNFFTPRHKLGLLLRDWQLWGLLSFYLPVWNSHTQAWSGT